jgi:hypothetical protein
MYHSDHHPQNLVDNIQARQSVQAQVEGRTARGAHQRQRLLHLDPVQTARQPNDRKGQHDLGPHGEGPLVAVGALPQRLLHVAHQVGARVERAHEIQYPVQVQFRDGLPVGIA